MKLTRRIGWMLSLECKCNADIVHIITESEVRDENGELPGVITCRNCGRPVLAIGDDGKLYAIGGRILLNFFLTQSTERAGVSDDFQGRENLRYEPRNNICSGHCQDFDAVCKKANVTSMKKYKESSFNIATIFHSVRIKGEYTLERMTK